LDLTNASTLLESVSAILSVFEGLKVDDLLNHFADADAIRAKAETTIAALRNLKTLIEQAEDL